jgi:predicted nucleic acid-binding protein
MVLVDSDVWSEAFRKKGKGGVYIDRLRELIDLDEVVMIGPIRQEILSGIREKKKFEEIRELLKAFPSQPIEDSVHELAAAFFSTCRSKGIQGSHTDFLICACGVAWKVGILSKDKDFQRYAKIVPIDLDGSTG